MSLVSSLQFAFYPQSALIHSLQSAFYADRFFNADTFLVRRDALRALFYTFLQNCDSTSNNLSLSQIKALLSLLKYKTKRNAFIAARN